jgi:hypothetical protein
MSEPEISEKAVKVKRAPRKQVAKAAATKTAPKPRKTMAKNTPARRAPRVVKEEVTQTDSAATESVTRKAPTVFATEKNKQKQRQKQFIIIGVILTLGVGASAAVGYTDKGQINVTQLIQERNQTQRTGDPDESGIQTSPVEVPVQNTNKTVNGGLVGLGTGGTKPKPPVDSATSTDGIASSTEAMASSTSTAVESASSTEESASESSDVNEPAEVTSEDVETATATSS